MKIKRYPGKAVVDDPAWLEMDIPNHARGQLYEANWIDTQKNLSNSSSNSNSWDKYSTKSDGTVSSRLGQYQSLLEEIRKDNNEDLYAAPKKLKTTDSIRLKYHSEKILSKINSKQQPYFLPSQAGQEETASGDDHSEKRPVPQPRAKLYMPEGEQKKFKVVLEDLQRQMKKSVRFDEVSTDIDEEIEKRSGDMEGGSTVRVIVNPTHELLEQINLNKHMEVGDDGRISQWVDTQNQYLSVEDQDAQDLTRNDSGYYEHSKKIRQRLPPKHIYPPSCSSKSDLNEKSSSDTDLDESDRSDSYYDEVYSIYKDGAEQSLKQRAVESDKPYLRNADFTIPRPKLLVPVHTYAIRRRRTGNISKESVSDFNYGTLGTNRRKAASKKKGL